MIETLIFDFDGVIIDTETPDYSTWLEVFSAHGVELDRARWSRVIGGGTEPLDVYALLEELTGRRLDRDAIRRRRREAYLRLVESSPVLPGVLGYLDEAERMGIKLGVASSSSRDWVEGNLTRRGLRRYFVSLLCRDDVSNVKPDPELYVESAKRLGTLPGRCLVIEDSLNGVTAAKRAGMFCVAVPNAMTRDMPLDEADARLESLAEVGLDALLARLSEEGPTAQ